MNYFLRLAIFLVINFGALGLGLLLQGEGGPMSSWYQTLNIAPWTPPGWFFGAAWTTIMILFSIYMAKLTQRDDTIRLYAVFLTQFILNVSWNMFFFNFHQIFLSLIIIVSLLGVMWYQFSFFREKMGNYSWLLAPYIGWLAIATSLNVYALVFN